MAIYILKNSWFNRSLENFVLKIGTYGTTINMAVTCQLLLIEVFIHKDSVYETSRRRVN
jgi:hypothetical protein